MNSIRRVGHMVAIAPLTVASIAGMIGMPPAFADATLRRAIDAEITHRLQKKMMEDEDIILYGDGSAPEFDGILGSRKRAVATDAPDGGAVISVWDDDNIVLVAGESPEPAEPIVHPVYITSNADRERLLRALGAGRDWETFGLTQYFTPKRQRTYPYKQSISRWSSTPRRQRGLTSRARRRQTRRRQGR